MTNSEIVKTLKTVLRDLLNSDPEWQSTSDEMLRDIAGRDDAPGVVKLQAGLMLQARQALKLEADAEAVPNVQAANVMAKIGAALTARVEELEAENALLRKFLDRNAPASARELFIEELRNEIDAKGARIAELEAENALLREMAKESGRD